MQSLMLDVRDLVVNNNTCDFCPLESSVQQEAGVKGDQFAKENSWSVRTRDEVGQRRLYVYVRVCMCMHVCVRLCVKEKQQLWHRSKKRVYGSLWSKLMLKLTDSRFKDSWWAGEGGGAVRSPEVCSLPEDLWREGCGGLQSGMWHNWIYICKDTWLQEEHFPEEQEQVQKHQLGDFCIGWEESDSGSGDRDVGMEETELGGVVVDLM